MATASRWCRRLNWTSRSPRCNDAYSAANSGTSVDSQTCCTCPDLPGRSQHVRWPIGCTASNWITTTSPNVVLTAPYSAAGPRGKDGSKDDQTAYAERGPSAHLLWSSGRERGNPTVGTNKRYVDAVDRRGGERIRERAATEGQLQRLADAERGLDPQPPTIDPHPKLAKACGKPGVTPVLVNALVHRWRPRACGTWFVVTGKQRHTRMWASSVSEAPRGSRRDSEYRATFVPWW